MTNLDRFLAEGAESCAGSLVYKRREIGTFRDGDLMLNDEGRELLAKLDEVTDVVVKAPKSKAKKADAEPTLADAEAQLDALLAE